MGGEAREMATQMLLVQRSGFALLTPRSDGSQLPLTPVPKGLKTFWLLQAPAHMRTHTHIYIDENKS